MRLATLIAVFVLLGPLAARADDAKDQAKRDVTAGLAAQSAGRYDEAIALYKKAYAAIPHPELLFDLGQAYRLKGDLETAIDYYRRYLEAEPGGRASGDAARWRSELDKRLADRRKADDARKPDSPTRPDPARKPGATGKVDARKADEARRAEEARQAQEAQALEDARKAEDARRADEARKAEAARHAEAARKAEDARKAEAARVAAAAASDQSQHGTATLVAALGGTGALVGGLVFGSLASSKLNEATALCGADHRCDSDASTRHANDLASQSRTRGTISTALVILGAGGLVTSGILWWTGRSSDAAGVAVAPLIGGGTLGVAIGGAL